MSESSILAKIFLPALAEPHRGVWAAKVDLAPRLAAALEACRLAWPTVELDAETFLAVLAARWSEDVDPFATLRVSHLYLATACARGDAAALATFEAAFGPDVRAAIGAMGLPRHEVDEIAQEVRVKLFVAQPGSRARIADYGGRADLGTWLRTVAVRVAISRGRGRKETPTDEDEFLLLPAVGDDPELQFLKQHFRNETRTAFADALGALTPRELELLRRHFVERASIDEMAPVYSVHRATAARWLTAAQEKLVRTFQQLLLERWRLSETDTKSILHLVESQLGQSIHRILASSRE